ncbi:MAG: hypothetical protein QNJ73_16895 [Gammaproteobacteria bacterium]|nr:hypothetical protein [Gammaproteobacteria bacterium]
MQSPSATHSTGSEREPGLLAKLRGLLFRKLWLPKIIYEGLPYVYIGIGIVALASALYAPGWTWILPYLALVGVACLHAGLAIVTLRYRFRRRHKGHSQTR